MNVAQCKPKPEVSVSESRFPSDFTQSQFPALFVKNKQSAEKYKQIVHLKIKI